MTTPATRERRRLADELTAVEPEAPTLCEGWTARDLAAHAVLRDRRPDAAVGVLVPAFAGHTDTVQSKLARQDWTRLVDQVRDGPPAWSPARLDRIDRLVNTTEFFVHLEDVRRARPAWEPRQLDDDLVTDLAAALGRSAKLLARRSPVGITLAPDDAGGHVVAKDRAPMVTVRGPVGELVLWTFGRQAHARVEYDGPDDAIESVRAARLGL